MVSRRGFLTGLGASGFALSATPASAFSAFGAINAVSEGLRLGSASNQGDKLQAILNKAARTNRAVFIEPGRYQVANVTLPKNTRIYGISGATRLEYAGGNHFIFAENAEHIELNSLVLDGGLLPIQEYANANLRVNNTKYVLIENCHFTSAAAHGVEIDKSGGRFERNRIDTAIGNAGFFGLENRGLTITDNLVEECANAGIMIYRWTRGEDNTIVTNNRVRRINAIKGGTGPWGNGINTYQCDGVIVANNHVSDCAFSTIRSNSCNNIQITNNTCFRAGETSIYSEFAFQGANISGNVIDGGARGISIANLDQGGRMSVCANNLIRNIHEHAPYRDENHLFGNGISAEADISITGNVIENAANFGLMLGWGNYLRNVVASANIIRDTKTGVYVSVVEGTGNVTIVNNVMSNITRGGVIGYRWRDPVTGDLARTRGKQFTNLKIKDNQVNG